MKDTWVKCFWNLPAWLRKAVESGVWQMSLHMEALRGHCTKSWEGSSSCIGESKMMEVWESWDNRQEKLHAGSGPSPTERSVCQWEMTGSSKLSDMYLQYLVHLVWFSSCFGPWFVLVFGMLYVGTVKLLFKFYNELQLIICLESQERFLTLKF